MLCRWCHVHVMLYTRCVGGALYNWYYVRVAQMVHVYMWYCVCVVHVVLCTNGTMYVYYVDVVSWHAYSLCCTLCSTCIFLCCMPSVRTCIVWYCKLGIDVWVVLYIECMCMHLWCHMLCVDAFLVMYIIYVYVMCCILFIHLQVKA